MFGKNLTLKKQKNNQGCPRGGSKNLPCRLAAFLSVFALLLCVPAGCQSKAAAAPRAKLLVNGILKAGGFAAPSLVFGQGDAEYNTRFTAMFHGEPTLAADGAFAVAADIAADEITVLKAKSGESTEPLKALLQTRLQEQIECYQSYSPKDTANLKNAELFCKGDFAILMVSEKATEMRTLCEDFLKNPQTLPQDAAGSATQSSAASSAAPASSLASSTQSSAPQSSAVKAPVQSAVTKSSSAASSKAPVKAPSKPEAAAPAEPVLNITKMPYVYAYANDVPASAAVENGYFSNTLFIGSSRLDGILEYSKITGAGRYAYTSLNVSAVFSRNVVKSKNGSTTIANAIKGKKFAKCYLEFGVNEMGWPHLEIFAREYKKIITYVRQQSPGIEVYLLNLYPVTASHSAKQAAKKGDETNANIKKMNDLLAKIAKENGVYLVNLAAAVCNQNGVLPEGCSTDGVHANVATSRSLMQYIKTHTHR